jgi:hypothetical protein
MSVLESLPIRNEYGDDGFRTWGTTGTRIHRSAEDMVKVFGLTAVIGRGISEGWRTFLSVYYANSFSWRVFKSGALVFLGFFLWSSANLLLSYQRSWHLLHYVMAYGFVLIP